MEKNPPETDGLRVRLLAEGFEIGPELAVFARSRATALLLPCEPESVELSVTAEAKGYRARAIVTSQGAQHVHTARDANPRTAVVGALGKVRRSIERLRQIDRMRRIARQQLMGLATLSLFL